MKISKPRSIPIARLRLPGEMGAMVRSERVAQRARVIGRLGGALHEPLVRSDWTVIVGFEEIAAYLSLGKTQVIVKVVECTDEEVEQIKTIHQFHVASPKGVSAPRFRDRVNDRVAKLSEVMPRCEAVKLVGQEFGIRVEGVNNLLRQQARLSMGLSKKGSRLVIPKAVKPVIETFGLELDEGWLRKISSLVGRIKRLEEGLRLTVGMCTRIQNDELPFPPSRLAHLRGSARSVSQLLAEYLPASICPYCKGVDGLMADCGACLGCGWVSKSQLEGTPKNLLEKEPLLVMKGGQTWLLDDFLKEQTG